MHGCHITESGIVNAYGPSTTWPFVVDYAIMAALFVVMEMAGERHPGPVERT